MKLSNSKKAALALITANMIWGAAPPVFKWSLEGIPMYTLAFLRFLIPTLILLAIINKKDLKVQRKDYKKVFYIGYTLITVNILFLFLGVERTVSINASVIAGAGPVFLMLGSLFMLKEKIEARIFLGHVIGFVGVLLIILQPLLTAKQPNSFLGNMFLVISTLGVIMGTILAKGIIKDYHPITLAFWSFAIGAITFFPLFILEVTHIGFLTHITLQGAIGIIFGSLLSSLTAYFLYFWSLKYFPASEVSVFTYIDPVTTIVVAIPLLHETITPIYIMGAFLVFFGIYIAERRIHYHPVHRLLVKE